MRNSKRALAPPPGETVAQLSPEANYARTTGLRAAPDNEQAVYPAGKPASAARTYGSRQPGAHTSAPSPHNRGVDMRNFEPAAVLFFMLILVPFSGAARRPVLRKASAYADAQGISNFEWRHSLEGG